MLAGHGVFAEDDAGRIRLTPRAEILQSDRSGSMRDLLTLEWQDISWMAYQELPAAVRNGDVAFERAFGASFFNYLSTHPSANSAFDRVMALFAEPESE